MFEVSNLRQGDKTRRGDVAWLNFLGPGQHLLIDVFITGAYRDAVLKDVCRIFRGLLPRLLWRMPSWMRTSDPLALFPSAMGVVRHRLNVPFVLEERGREVWGPCPSYLV